MVVDSGVRWWTKSGTVTVGTPEEGAHGHTYSHFLPALHAAGAHAAGGASRRRKVSSDWIQTAVGVVVGGMISYWASKRLAEDYFNKQNDLSEQMAREQNARAEHVFELMVRMTKGIITAVESEAQTHIHLDRDEKGRNRGLEGVSDSGTRPDRHDDETRHRADTARTKW